MHVYNINSKFTPLKLRRYMIKRMEKDSSSIKMIVFGHTDNVNRSIHGPIIS